MGDVVWEVEVENVDVSTARTDLVTDPSPAKTGTGTSRVIFLTHPRPVVTRTRDPWRVTIPVSITT